MAALTRKLHNLSTRRYGRNTEQRRRLKVELTDMTGSFVLESAFRSENHLIHHIPEIEPISQLKYFESMTVASATKPFTSGGLRLTFHLQDPHKEINNLVVHYDIHVQISEAYVYNPSSRFLLIVNAYTENNAITQMKSFIQNDLHLGVDILNLSLTGTFKDKDSDESVLPFYQGKSIIVAGNPFNYFGSFQRHCWDLIDPSEALFLAMNKTSFLFSGVCAPASHASLNEFSKLVKYPIINGPAGEGAPGNYPVRAAMIKAVTAQLASSKFALGKYAQYPLSNGLRLLKPKMVKRLAGHVKATQVKLDKTLPTHRFVVAGIEILGEIVESQKISKKSKPKTSQKRKPSTGVIVITEGLCRTVGTLISFAPVLFDEQRISQHQVIMMIATIPFSDLAKIFWNVVRGLDASGLHSNEFYSGLSAYANHEEETEKTGKAVVETLKIISKEVRTRILQPEEHFTEIFQICTAVAWAVEQALDSDIQQLCSTNPRFDAVNSQAKILAHVPRLRHFLEAIPKDKSSQATKQGLEVATQVLTSLSVSLSTASAFRDACRGVPGFSDRRRTLRGAVLPFYKQALMAIASPAEINNVRKLIAKEVKILRTSLKADKHPRTYQDLIRRRLSTTIESAAPNTFEEVGAGADGSLSILPGQLDGHRSAHYQNHVRRQADEATALTARQAMMANAQIERQQAERISKLDTSSTASRSQVAIPEPAKVAWVVSPDMTLSRPLSELAITEVARVSSPNTVSSGFVSELPLPGPGSASSPDTYSLPLSPGSVNAGPSRISSPGVSSVGYRSELAAS